MPRRAALLRPRDKVNRVGLPVLQFARKKNRRIALRAFQPTPQIDEFDRDLQLPQRDWGRVLGIPAKDRKALRKHLGTLGVDERNVFHPVQFRKALTEKVPKWLQVGLRGGETADLETIKRVVMARLIYEALTRDAKKGDDGRALRLEIFAFDESDAGMAERVGHTVEWFKTYPWGRQDGHTIRQEQQMRIAQIADDLYPIKWVGDESLRDTIVGLRTRFVRAVAQQFYPDSFGTRLPGLLAAVQEEYGRSVQNPWV